MDCAPLISIIIPTKNRFPYATACVRSILDHKSSQFEIIVQDNSDDDRLRGLLEDLCSDTRLRYNYLGRVADVQKNFDAGFSRAQGRYVTFLGDDDGINCELIDAVEWADSQNLDALLPTRPARYWWPDIRFKYYGSRFSGSLEIAPFSGTISSPNLEYELRTCVNTAGLDFLSSSLPRVYYGVVRRSCLQQVVDKAGTAFPGPSPDLSSAVALASVVQSIRRIDYPLFLPGTCAASTGGWGAAKRHIGRLEDFDHLPQHYVSHWSKQVPKFFAGSTIWAQDVVQALKAMGREDLLQNLNSAFLHGRCLALHPQYAMDILRSYLDNTRCSSPSKTKSFCDLFRALATTMGLRIQSFIERVGGFNVQGKLNKLEGLPNIGAASMALREFLNASGHKFSSLVG